MISAQYILTTDGRQSRLDVKEEGIYVVRDGVLSLYFDMDRAMDEWLEDLYQIRPFDIRKNGEVVVSGILTYPSGSRVYHIKSLDNPEIGLKYPVDVIFFCKYFLKKLAQE